MEPKSPVQLELGPAMLFNEREGLNGFGWTTVGVYIRHTSSRSSKNENPPPL